MASNPQRFTPRASSNQPGRLRRAADGKSISDQQFQGSLAVDKGLLGVKMARGSGLKVTREGLSLDEAFIEKMVRPPLAPIKDPAAVTAAAVHQTLTDLLRELRRTGSLRQ